MTNYEKIKNMTVEQMADALKRLCPHDYGMKKCAEQSSCALCRKNWLESEAKE